MKKTLKTLVGAAAALLVLASCANPVVDGGGTPNPPGPTDRTEYWVYVDATTQDNDSELFAFEGTMALADATELDTGAALPEGAKALKVTNTSTSWSAGGWTAATSADLSGFNTLVLHVLAKSAEFDGSLKVKMGGTTESPEILVPFVADGTWKKISIPMTSFTGVDMSAITKPLIFVSVDVDHNDIFYLDKIYYTKLADEEIAPVITLTGNSEITLFVGDTYVEQGAVVTDNRDNSLSVVIGGDPVDTNTAGTYVVTYDATDSDGNAADQKRRTVIVLPLNFGPELAINGDFSGALDTDLQYFDQIVGASTGTVQSGELVLDIIAAGAPYQNRMVMNGYNLVNGKRYFISFDAKAGVEGKKLRVQHGIILTGDPWYTNIMGDELTFDLTTEMTTYTLTFVAANTSTNIGMAIPTLTNGYGVQDLIFATGDDGILTTITIDNLSIKEIL